MSLRVLFFLLAAAAPSALSAQSTLQTSGATIVIAGNGEVTRANDEAYATFAIEEQDKEKAKAASRVNEKMKQGTEIVKREDPRAKLKTQGYYTYAVYEDEPRPLSKTRQLVGWRVGQYLQVTTTNLEGLPKTVAATQRVLGLNGLRFGLSAEALRKVDQERIEAAYRNLTERIASIAKAMGRNPSDAVLDTVDFEGSGMYAPAAGAAPQARGLMASKSPEPQAIEEPSFEPGETTLQMRVVGRVKFR